MTNPDNPRPNPDPDPERATGGSAAGGQDVPGDTPPSTSQMPGTAGDARRVTPNMGPVSGNRTPMLITLGILAFIVIAIAVITGASFLPS